jgi:serine/threonine-protein kinase
MVAGRYELERPLGHGAMATVDLARDVELDRPVALKRLAENLARDDELRARFLREARLAARLAHPNVVHVYDVGEDDGRPFMAMEYVDGETLAELVARRGPLPAEEAAELGIQICRGLAAVHAAGLVHRDVKPQNLLLRRDGVLKLGDFGIAFGLEGTRLTMAGTVLGTAAYLAPEQARGEDVTAAADVYGVGAVLYELLTGRPPRAPASLAELASDTAILPPAGAPPALAAVVMRCLARDPRERPASADEVARELAFTEHPTEIMAPSRSRTKRRVRPAVALAAVAVGAIVGGVGAAIATSGDGSKPPPARVTVTPVPHGATAEQQAQNLAAWLTRYSR